MCAMRINPKENNRMDYILKVATSTFQHIIDTSHEIKSKRKHKNQTQSLTPYNPESRNAL